MEWRTIFLVTLCDIKQTVPNDAEHGKNIKVTLVFYCNPPTVILRTVGKI